jgi:hypothetical protein
MPQRAAGAPRGHEKIAYVAAGSAANSTLYYYIDMDDFKSCDLLFEWTAGAGGGTVVFTVEGTKQTGSDHTTLTFEDITLDLLKVASLADDFSSMDDGQVAGHWANIRCKVIVANKDNATTYTIYAHKKG